MRPKSINALARGMALSVCFATLFLSACSAEGQAPSTATVADQAMPIAEELSPERQARIAEMAAQWDSEPAYNANFNVLDPSANTTQEMRTSPFDPNDPHWGLPEAEGRELVEAYCGACHSLRLVMQPAVTPGWNPSGYNNNLQHRIAVFAV